MSQKVVPKVYQAEAATRRIMSAMEQTALAKTSMPDPLETHIEVLITLGMLDAPGSRVTFAIDSKKPDELQVVVWDAADMRILECLGRWSFGFITRGTQAWASVPMDDTFESMRIFISTFAECVGELAVA